MSEVNRVIESLERQLVDTKAQVAFGDAVARLVKNPDYRTVIEKGFMLEECARYAQASGNPALSDRERADALLIAQAAGALKRFLAVTIQISNQCANDILAIEHSIEEARMAGEDENEE